MKYTQQSALITLLTGVPGAGEYLGPSGDYSTTAVGKPQGPLIDLILEAETFSDVAPHVIAEFPVEPGRTNLAIVFLSAHDDAGSEIGFSLAAISLTRFGSGPILIYGLPLPVPVGLAFAPIPMLWTADFVEATPGKLGISVANVGSPGIPIRWKASVAIFGTQVK